MEACLGGVPAGSQLHPGQHQLRIQVFQDCQVFPKTGKYPRITLKCGFFIGLNNTKTKAPHWLIQGTELGSLLGVTQGLANPNEFALVCSLFFLHFSPPYSVVSIVCVCVPYRLLTDQLIRHTRALGFFQKIAEVGRLIYQQYNDTTWTLQGIYDVARNEFTDTFTTTTPNVM